MAQRPPTADLAPREREIFDIVFRLGRATAEEIRRRLDDPPSNSSVRKMLGLLEKKGFVRHVEDGPRYVYLPAVDRSATRNGALRHVIQTFFEGSPESLVTALIDSRVSREQLLRIDALIKDATKPEASGEDSFEGGSDRGAEQ